MRRDAQGNPITIFMHACLFEDESGLLIVYNLTKWACTCPPISWIPTYLIYVSKDPDRLGLA